MGYFIDKKYTFALIKLEFYFLYYYNNFRKILLFAYSLNLFCDKNKNTRLKNLSKNNPDRWGQMISQSRMNKETLSTQMRICMDGPEIQIFLPARSLKVIFLEIFKYVCLSSLLIE